MNRKKACPLIASLAVGLSAPTALAYDACEEFTVQWAVDKVTSIDLLEEGRSIGDQMVVRGNISDMAGTPVGSMFVNSTVMPYSDDLEDSQPIPFFAIMHYIFPDGRLTTSGIFERHDTGTNTDLPPVTFEYPIIGGTGIFSHTTGTMVASTDDSGTRLLNFRPRCHD